MTVRCEDQTLEQRRLRSLTLPLSAAASRILEFGLRSFPHLLGDDGVVLPFVFLPLEADYCTNHKVSLPKLVNNLASGLGLGSAGHKVIDHEQIWRLGTTQSGRAKPVTWYFARQLYKPEVAYRLREQIRLEKTTESSVVLTSTDLPLPAASPIEGFDVRFLGMTARISQSRFEFFDESASTATQVMAEATPTTTLKYVESQSCVWMDGERYELEPRQRLIIIALLEDLDHELDKDALQRKCGSQSQSFSPSKEFERNKSVYKRFIRYLRDDERYQLLIPLEDQTH